jgi:FMN phosphatase YigB (HAD superfamily)
MGDGITLAVQKHAQLDGVLRMIADKSCSVLSLDIFDTILWRRVPRPTDLFTVLGAHLRTSGCAPEWISDAAFRRMRIGAEEKARSRRGSLGSEVSLYDIWQAMPDGVFDSANLAELVAAELHIERSFTVVDLDIAAVISAAKQHGIPVVLVSDTYFTEDQLACLLDRPEIGPLEDVHIFRSHQHGTDKGAGLWEIVLSNIGRTPSQVLHIGDNAVADHAVPAGLGVRTLHYERIDADFEHIIRREGETLDSAGLFGELVDPVHGDFGITTLRARTLQAHAPSVTAAVLTAWRYGASVLGPVLTGFAEWVALKAHEAGTPVVWCPMREGELLATLVNNAARERGWQVEAKPLWLSRHVTSVAALDALDPDAVREFIRQRYQLTVRQLLTMLHLHPGDVPSLVESLDIVLDTEQIVDQVTVALTETPHLRNRLAVTVTAARERLLRSLQDRGALDGKELTLVDLGWGGTIQYQLAKILRIAEIELAPAGLYLATDERSTRVLLSGLRIEGFLGQAGHPREVVGAVCRSPEVVEQCVNALCGSLIGFTEEGEPVLGPAAGSSSQNAERKAVQDGILAFQANWNRYVRAAGGDWPTLTAPAAPRLANILTAALKAPTAQEAAVLGNWAHEDNFGSAVVTRVVPADLVSAIPYLSPNDLDDLHMRDSFWPALLAASDPQLGAAVRAVATGAIESSVFDPAGEPFETRLRYRVRNGQWHDGPRRRVRINHNGLSFARLNFAGRDVSDVAVAIPGRPAIVRVDWIEARVIAGGGAVPQVLLWNKPEDFAGLTFAECTWLGGNLVEFEHPHSAMWLPLAVRSGAPVSSAQITIAFAMLPQSMSKLGPRMPAAAVLSRMSGRIVEEYRAHGRAGVLAGAARVVARKLAGNR